MQSISFCTILAVKCKDHWNNIYSEWYIVKKVGGKLHPLRSTQKNQVNAKTQFKENNCQAQSQLQLQLD